MRVLVQRSNQANVIVDEKVVGKIDSGLVLLVGFTEGDSIDNIEYLAKKMDDEINIQLEKNDQLIYIKY